MGGKTNGKIIYTSKCSYCTRNGDHSMGDSVEVSCPHKASLGKRVAYYFGVTDDKSCRSCRSYGRRMDSDTNHIEPHPYPTALPVAKLI